MTRWRAQACLSVSTDKARRESIDDMAKMKLAQHFREVPTKDQWISKRNKNNVDAGLSLISMTNSFIDFWKVLTPASDKLTSTNYPQLFEKIKKAAAKLDQNIITYLVDLQKWATKNSSNKAKKEGAAAIEKYLKEWVQYYLQESIETLNSTIKVMHGLLIRVKDFEQKVLSLQKGVDDQQLTKDERTFTQDEVKKKAKAVCSLIEHLGADLQVIISLFHDKSKALGLTIKSLGEQMKNEGIPAPKTMEKVNSMVLQPLLNIVNEL